MNSDTKEILTTINRDINLMENQIIDNRIVNYKTFATRFLSFLERLYGNGITYSGPMEEEEYEYMCMIACDLLKHQVETCPDNEKWYFENLVKGYTDYLDIIEKHIAKNNESFVNFLRVIKAIERKKKNED